MIKEVARMSSYFFQGQRTHLRAVEPSDAETHFLWNQDSEMSRNIDRVWLPGSREAAKRWAEHAASREPSGDDFQFVIENLQGEHVGLVGTHDCDARNGTFSLGIAVRREHQRRGYAADAIRTIMRYYFEELRYQKLTVHVHEFNDASLRLFERLNFQHEGRVRRVMFTEGRFIDQIILGITAEESTQYGGDETI
jgi:RimJ/RimL family protein N-acetyltransferase